MKYEKILITCWQNSHNLTPDGVLGPKTRASLDKRLDYLPNQTMRVAFESALCDVGEKEVPLGSNMGDYVESLRKEAGLTRKGGGEWCAVFQTVHLRRAGVDVGSRAARGIVRLVADKGRYVPKDDVGEGFYGLSLHRRGVRSHHVRIFRTFVHDGKTYAEYIGGNEKHRVVSKTLLLRNFMRDVLKVATV